MPHSFPTSLNLAVASSKGLGMLISRATDKHNEGRRSTTSSEALRDAARFSLIGSLSVGRPQCCKQVCVCVCESASVVPMAECVAQRQPHKPGNKRCALLIVARVAGHHVRSLPCTPPPPLPPLPPPLQGRVCVPNKSSRVRMLRPPSTEISKPE